ncbi:AlpA family phage regulatory protein [Rhizobium laguerreae]|uniref:helix-turn-helix transcriptional regulator n=1 Tax=Rhizobium laguerreae TaxID=1076926 RepID=UPI001C91ED79|nr:AlpA family phage regulatory protein [Rhizobium laguerreae]
MRAPKGLLTLKQVMKLTGLSESSIRRRWKANRFPPKLRQPPHRVAMAEAEVVRYLADPEAYLPPDERTDG